jgi:predicted RNA-binding protein with PUA-like domain
VPGTFYNLAVPFLVKEEPSTYNFDNFVKDGGTTWSGVRNPVAQKHLRSIRKGDQVFYYHTGSKKAIVGIARATGAAYADPADRAGKAYVVDLAPVRKLARPVTLAEIKADKRFADFPLTYMPRLSVMPVTEKQWEMILAMAKR